MGWSIGYDSTWNRDIGYGVPCQCDQPGCTAEIDRGLSYVCGSDPRGGEHGCGLYFCSSHLYLAETEDGRSVQNCERCRDCEDWFEAKPDTREWINHKLTHPSWADWRKTNRGFVRKHSTLFTPFVRLWRALRGEG